MMRRPHCIYHHHMPSVNTHRPRHTNLHLPWSDLCSLYLLHNNRPLLLYMTYYLYQT